MWVVKQTCCSWCSVPEYQLKEKWGKAKGATMHEDDLMLLGSPMLTVCTT